MPATRARTAQLIARLQYGSGALLLKHLQLPGGREQPVNALLNAHHTLFAPGKAFGS